MRYKKIIVWIIASLLITANGFSIFVKNIELIFLRKQISNEIEHVLENHHNLSFSSLRLLSAYLLKNQEYTKANTVIMAIPVELRNDFDNLRQAQALAMMGQIEEAQLQAENLPISTDVLVSWAISNWSVLGGSDHVPLARLWFTIASEREDGSWVSRRAVGAWWQWWEPARAIPYLESVVREQPDDVFTHYLLGLAYRDMRMLDSAVYHLEQVVKKTDYTIPQYCSELVQVYLLRNQVTDIQNARELTKLCL